MGKIEAVIFDMDGVIFDSERLVIKAWKQIAVKYRIPDIEAACEECLGINAAKTKELMLKRYGKDFPYEAYKRECSEIFHREAAGGKLPQKTGAKELLSYLKSRNILVGLASSTRREVVLEELKEGDLLQYFDCVVCGDMVKESKPSPDIYLKACAQLKVKPKECYAIEDSYNGIRSSFRASMKPLMVPDMAPPTEEMENLAVAIFPSLWEVKEYFEEILEADD